MRVLGMSALVAVLGLSVGCGPSASIKRTTPIGSLQVYQAALVRVTAAPGLEHYAPNLEYVAARSLERGCSFLVVPNSRFQVGQAVPDLIVDLRIQRSRRGGDGFVRNPNLATVNVTMVLSDGIDESLLGSAEFEGKSSSVFVQRDNAETEAFSAVAKTIVKVLGKSGCYGQRVARIAPTVPQPIYDLTPEQLRQGEEANDEGKRLFRVADIAGAKAQFEQALRFVPDPRYQFNLCLAHEGLSEFDRAEQACQAVISGQAEPRLVDKASQRLAIIAAKR